MEGLTTNLTDDVCNIDYNLAFDTDSIVPLGFDDLQPDSSLFVTPEINTQNSGGVAERLALQNINTHRQTTADAFFTEYASPTNKHTVLAHGYPIQRHAAPATVIDAMNQFRGGNMATFSTQVGASLNGSFGHTGGQYRPPVMQPMFTSDHEYGFGFNGVDGIAGWAPDHDIDKTIATQLTIDNTSSEWCADGENYDGLLDDFKLLN